MAGHQRVGVAAQPAQQGLEQRDRQRAKRTVQHRSALSRELGRQRTERRIAQGRVHRTRVPPAPAAIQGDQTAVIGVTRPLPRVRSTRS